MSAIKNYYHDEICQQDDDPQADYPNPEEEQWQAQANQDQDWWESVNSDKEYIAEQESEDANS